jgi:hypothetical protein
MLTARYDNPDEVHEEEVKPEVICFRSAVCQVLVIVIEHARSIVENVAVYLTQGDHSLEGEAHRMLRCDEVCDKVGQRTPADLEMRLYQLGSGKDVQRNSLCLGRTNRSNSLHTQDEWVRGKVSRV